MLQTVGAMSGVNAIIEISLDGGVTWAQNISGSTNQVSAPEQRRVSGEAYTFVGDTAVIGSGKREPVEVGFRCIYTELAGDAWQILRPLFEAGTRIWIRWRFGTAMLNHTIQNGVIVRFSYPAADAADAAPIMCEFAVRAAAIISA